MARMLSKLSAVELKSLKKGYHNDGGGLYFRVADKDARGWIFRFTMHGRTRDMGLGSYQTLSLAKARKKAGEARELVANGIDPIERRKAERMEAALAATQGMTFKEAAKAYIESHEAAWRNPKHRQQWRNTLKTYVYPTLGSLSVQGVTVGLVMRVLEPIWTTKPETASRVRQRIETVLDWATAHGYRTGENPARWRGHLENLLPKKTKVHRVKHHAALDDDAVADFMVALRQQTNIGARALEFLILTATRTGEVLNAKWDEVDLEGHVWTIPAERIKGGREHRVPLSDAAVGVLEAMAELKINEFIFPGAKQGRPLSQMAMAMLLRRMGHGGVTVHGFRSAFRDWAAERTNFPNHVVEMALAHTIADAVEAAYRRGDLFEKRRRLMDAWAEFCGKQRAPGAVVTLRSA